MNPTDYLKDCHSRFDPKRGFIGTHFHNPGYHTRVPSGEWAYPVLDNFSYAALLLQSADKDLYARAHDILQRLLDLQDQDPVNTTYGIWPWLTEEPLEQMSPPDWNWADFCGGRIAEILVESANNIEKPLLERLHTSLGHAAASIFRRNITPGYTNIAIMGAGVCAAAGELLGEKWLLEYGRRRLESCVTYTAWNDGFTEYNSPAYFPVVIRECERILYLVKDDATRSHADSLRRTAWQIIAKHFHPATGQWAGPHARAYSDRLSPQTATFLSERTGIFIRSMEKDAPIIQYQPEHAVPCPAEFISAFQKGARHEIEIEGVLERKNDDSLTIRGTLWMAPDACLGSASRSNMNTQSRPLIAYWHSSDDPAVVLKVSLLKDGREFSSGVVRNAQSGRRVLTAINLANDLGDWHPTLDKPADGRFLLKDLRLRYQVIGKGAAAREMSDNLFSIGCGTTTACIHTAPSLFGTQPVRWEVGHDQDRCWLDAVCYSGPETHLIPAELSDIRLGAGLELLHGASSPSAEFCRWENGSSKTNSLKWLDLKVEIPRQTEKYRG